MGSAAEVVVSRDRQAQTGVNVSENCYNSQSSSEQVNCGSAVGYPLPYLFTPGVTPWERGRPARVASLRARCPRSRRNVNTYACASVHQGDVTPSAPPSL